MRSGSKFYLFIFCFIFCSVSFIAHSSLANEITFLAAGDVVLVHRIDPNCDFDFFSEEVLDIIYQADAFFWNCEFSGLSSKVKTNDYIFLSNGTLINKFAFSNAIASTSNNHVFDGYQEGALHLMDSFETAGASHNGLHSKGEYSPLEKFLPNGTQLFFLSGAPMSQTGSGPEIVTLNYEEILEQVPLIRNNNPDAIIVTYFHDGTDKEISLTPRQKDIAKKCANLGVDVVLFSHNHIYGEFEELINSPRRTFVAWGLGNFIFGGNFEWKNKNDVRMLQITIDKNTMHKSGKWINGYTADWKFFLNDYVQK